MKRASLLPLLIVAALGGGISLAIAQDSLDSGMPNSSSTGNAHSSADSHIAGPESPITTFKLFAGVAHQQMLPQAHEVLKPHLDRQLPHPAAIAHSTSATATSVLAGQAMQKASQPAPQTSSVSSAHSAFTQNYVPAFGVARLTAERTPDPPRPAQHYIVQWFMIPSWMAGVWQKDGDMTTHVTDLRTGRTSNQNEFTENRLQATWGHQRDSQGNYWHVNILPAERDGASAGKLVRFVTVNQNCESSTSAQLMTRTHYIVSESNPWSHQPIDTFQQESLNHYALSGQKQLINSSSNRVFTYQGEPVREGHLVSQFVKVGAFAPVASMNGIDLRASLNDFLQNRSSAQQRK